MGYFKIDKLDKIFIAFTFIVVTIFSVFNCFCFASEYVELTTNYNLVASLQSNTFIESNAQSCVSFFAEKGYKYKISVLINQNQERVVVSSSSRPASGVSFDILYNSLMHKDDYFVFTPNDDTFVTISRNVAQGAFQVEKIPISGFEDSIKKLTSDVGLSSFWSTFESSIPWVLVVVLFAFGWWFFAHWIKEISKGREF